MQLTISTTIQTAGKWADLPRVQLIGGGLTEPALCRDFCMGASNRGI
jgi:hypothetical protein